MCASMSQHPAMDATFLHGSLPPLLPNTHTLFLTYYILRPWITPFLTQTSIIFSLIIKSLFIFAKMERQPSMKLDLHLTPSEAEPKTMTRDQYELARVYHLNIFA
jgi:hypothetical protein